MLTYSSWVGRQIRLARSLEDGVCEGTYADAAIILCSSIDAMAALMWVEGVRDNKKRFTEIVAGSGAVGGVDAKTISIPLLCQSHGDLEKAINPEDDNIAWNLTSDDDDLEDFVLTAHPEVVQYFEKSEGSLRDFSYANLLYEGVRCGYIHTYNPTDVASGYDGTRSIFNVDRSKISYVNEPLLVLPPEDYTVFRKIYFPVDWISGVAMNVAAVLDSECVRLGKYFGENLGNSFPAAWWIDRKRSSNVTEDSGEGSRLLLDDPFFTLPAEHTGWNALIGNQGGEQNYLEGYIDAAIELAGAIIDKNMFEKRDTFVLPMLYNARHAVELVLKFSIGQLATIDLISNVPGRTHDIRRRLDLLTKANIGDEELRRYFLELEPFVASLSRVDNDGQQLRYRLDQDGNQNLSGESRVNLLVIRDGLNALSPILLALRYRIFSFIDERNTHAFTARCSRRDLIAIANSMPLKANWKDSAADNAKETLKARFNLSNSQFTKAIAVVLRNREMKALLGVETDLLFLTDEDVIFVVEQWRQLHPREEAKDELGHDYFEDAGRRFDAMKRLQEIELAVYPSLLNRLTLDMIADLEVIFYIGRDGVYSEFYEERVSQVRSEHQLANNPKQELNHLLEKTNFLSALRESLAKLGKRALVERLADY